MGRVKRDRLVWVGDMHPEMMTVWSVFGADPSVAKSLDFIRKETPLPGWMNNIASYTMWYAIIVHDWYMYTGDLAWVRHQAEYLKGICRQLSENTGPDGADSIPTGRFLDWPTSDRKKATDAGMHALHFMAEKKLSVLMDALGETELAVQCRADLEQLKRYSADCEDSKQAGCVAGACRLGQIRKGLMRICCLWEKQREPVKECPPLWATIFWRPGLPRGIIPDAWSASGNTGAACCLWEQRHSGRILTSHG